jgi:hypothetical protein
MSSRSGDAGGHPPEKTSQIEVSFPHATRLVTGKALVQDVWSIFNAANLPKDTINLGQGTNSTTPMREDGSLISNNQVT